MIMEDKERLKSLYKLMVEKAWEYKNPFLPSCCSALPILDCLYRGADITRDRIILSKGHAGLAHNIIKQSLGIVSDMSEFMDESYTLTGSLGHGIPVGVGIALAKKIGKKPGVVYVLVGDGECQEGTTWESLCVINRFGLDNVQVHIDHNQYQGCGKSQETAVSILLKASPAFFTHERIKGYGIDYLEKRPWIHTFKMRAEQYTEIMEQFR